MREAEPTRPRAWRELVVSLLFLCAVSCAGHEDGSTVECRSTAIVGGVEHAEYVALASSQQRAIARLLADGGSCTAVVVAPRTALTASHCILSETSTASLHFDSESGVPRVVAVAVTPHPTLDLAILTFSPDDDALDAIEPIAVDLGYPGDQGDFLQLAGYGFTEQGDLGLLRFATERVVETDETFLRVSGGRRSGACYGDSGGPALSRLSDGSVRVVGILSSGASGCADTDQYTRLRVAGSWLAEHGVLPGPALELADCALVGGEGRCFGASVLTCPDGVSPRIEHCEAGTGCGFDGARGTFGCVPPSMDPCEGLGDLGACEGDERLRCEAGSIVSAPCMACGATCQASVRDGRAICTF